MIILGVDVGSVNVGYAVCQIEDTKNQILESGSWIFKNKILGDRLVALEKSTEDLFSRYAIEQLAYELPYLRGANTHAVYMASGINNLLASRHGVPLKTYTASEVKKSVSGSGSADKEVVAEKVREFFNLPADYRFKSDHESDAIGIAMTHYFLIK
jgi:crossover junction endodeoxyribonuclease RuvC